MFQPAKYRISHFKTVLLAVLFSSCVFAQSLIIERPSHIYSELNEESQARWSSYISKLSQVRDQQVMESEFNWLMFEFAGRRMAPNSGKYLSLLGEKRTLLPIEIRWLLAALEIDYQMVSEATIQDAISALKYTNTAEKFNLIDMRKELSESLYYRKAGDSQDRILTVASLRSLIYLYRHWHLVPTLMGDQVLPVEIQKKRIQWLKVITVLRVYYNDIVELVNDFDHPRMLAFSSDTEWEYFLDMGVELSKKMGLMYGDPFFNENGYTHYFVEGFAKPQYERITSLVKTWIHNNLKYKIKHFDRIKRAKFIEADDILNFKLNETDLKAAIDILQNQSVPVDSYLLNAMMLLSQKQDLPRQVVEKAYTVVTDIFIQAAIQKQGVRLALNGFQDQFLPANEFDHLLLHFYNTVEAREDMPESLAIKVLKTRTLKTTAMSEKRWIEFEWKRLQVLQKNINSEIMKEYLVQTVIGDTTSVMVERLLAAKYLRLRMSIDNMEILSARVKSHFQGSKVKVGAEVSNQVWEKNEGELVTLIRALHPTDADLQKFLSAIYAGRRLDGPIAGHTALYHLTAAGIGTDEVRDEVLRRLKFVSAGDSSGTFRALIRMYPEEGEKIVEIIHRHRSAPEKLKLMLMALLEEIEMNPDLLLSIKKGLETQKDRSIPLAEYQKLKLDAWLELQLEKRRVSRGVAPRCNTVVSGQKG